MRFGVVSTANISKKVIAAIRRAGHKVTAVSSRDQTKASLFAHEHDIPHAFGSHDELIQSPEVDAVYLCLPTAPRTAVAVKAAKAKKHVLAEKPFASAEDVRVMVAACEENDVVFSDGTMFVHHPRTEALLRDLKAGELGGRVKDVRSAFSFPYSDHSDIRFDPALEPQGALGDLGWYNAKATLLAMDWELPVSVQASAERLPATGAIIAAQALMTFKDGRTGSFTLSFSTGFRQSLEITGEKATLVVDDFVITKEWGPDPPGRTPPRTRREGYLITDGLNVLLTRSFDTVVQEEIMIRDFVAAAADKGLREKWAREALLTQTLLDMVHKAIVGAK